MSVPAADLSGACAAAQLSWLANLVVVRLTLAGTFLAGCFRSPEGGSLFHARRKPRPNIGGGRRSGHSILKRQAINAFWHFGRFDDD